LVVEKLRAPLAFLCRQTIGVLGRSHRHGKAALDRGPRAQLLEPSLEVFELFDVLPLTLPIDCPGIADHVGDGVFVAGEIAAVIEPIVEHAIESVGLVGEATHGVGLVALFVFQAQEMAAFAEFRALVGHLPDHPLVHLMPTPQFRRIEAARFLRQIHHDRAGFEDADRRAAIGRLVIHDRRHAIVGADLQELGFELIALADVARHDVVRRPQLLQQDGDLLAVRRRPIMHVDHPRPLRMSIALSFA
jgi:hypothetical protein